VNLVTRGAVHAHDGVVTVDVGRGDATVSTSRRRGGDWKNEPSTNEDVPIGRGKPSWCICAGGGCEPSVGVRRCCAHNSCLQRFRERRRALAALSRRCTVWVAQGRVLAFTHFTASASNADTVRGSWPPVATSKGSKMGPPGPIRNNTKTGHGLVLWRGPRFWPVVEQIRKLFAHDVQEVASTACVKSVAHIDLQNAAAAVASLPSRLVLFLTRKCICASNCPGELVRGAIFFFFFGKSPRRAAELVRGTTTTRVARRPTDIYARSAETGSGQVQ
jgi:hypothetical protein